MKTYWDSSALLAALHNVGKRAKIKPEPDGTKLHGSRPHSLSEIFTSLTKGVKYRYTPADAANMIEDLVKDLDFVELTSADTLAAVKSASSLGVMGARIHDLMHARAAEKFGAKELLTLDQAGFTGLSTKLTIKAP